MSRLDLIIFGATGFTGKHVVIAAIRFTEKYGGLKWGIAGRSSKKLENVKAEIKIETGYDLSNIKTIIADVNDEQSLVEMCKQTNVMVNCCGPYRMYGEQVVKAAIETKTHYVDVSGEPEFIETMQLLYHDRARDAGVYIISACGFDSIPCDMGVVFLQQKFEGTLNSVESYISATISPECLMEAFKSGSVHFGTWESLVYSLSESSNLAPLRRKLYPEPIPKFDPKLLPRSTIHKMKNEYCLPFPGADSSVVYRTQRYLYEKEQKRPVQFKVYVTFPTLFLTILTIFGVVILYLMTMTSFTRKMLLRFPRLFSFGFVTVDGPKTKVMENTHFKVTLRGEGWDTDVDVKKTLPRKKLTAQVTGVNPGYAATATMLLASAITVLKEQDKIPDNGGVLTTGAAFRYTGLIKLLNENGVKFEIIES